MKKWLICLIVIIGFAFSQNHNTFGRVINFADTTGWYWLVWHVAGNPDTIIWTHVVDKNHPESESFWFSGPPPFAVWNFDFGNWSPPAWANGDRLIIQTDWDSVYGELTHKGFYSIINDTLDATQNPQTLQDDTLRPIPNPIPAAWDSVHGDTLFTSVDTIDLVWDLPKQTTGIPDTNNIIGYGVYRDTSGTGEDDTLSDGSYQYFEFTKFVSDTFCQDTLPAGYDGHIYYCIKLVYRPDTTGAKSEPGFSTRFLSQNSILIYNTPIVGIEEHKSQIPKTDPPIPQIFPNPFFRNTRIVFSVPTTMPIKISIYNASGQLMKTLIDETIPAGEYTIEYNGTDKDGIEIPSGVYFHLLQSVKCNQTARLIKLR